MIDMINYLVIAYRLANEDAREFGGDNSWFILASHRSHYVCLGFKGKGSSNQMLQLGRCLFLPYL